jgi:hypothetical protein
MCFARKPPCRRSTPSIGNPPILGEEKISRPLATKGVSDDARESRRPGDECSMGAGEGLVLLVVRDSAWRDPTVMLPRQVRPSALGHGSMIAPCPQAAASSHDIEGRATRQEATLQATLWII